MWRSPVAHLVRDEGVAGSNPVIPTNFKDREQGFEVKMKNPVRRQKLEF